MSENSKKDTRIKYSVVFSILALIVFFASCKKDSGIGTTVLPPGSVLGVNFVDTSTIISSIKIKDSSLSSSVSLYMLGSYNDPLFGSTKASVYTQLVLPGNSIDFTFGINGNSGIILDSVVLALPFNSSPAYYGALSPQTFTVDTIARVNGVGLINGHSYYSDTNISHGNNHVGVATITPDPIDSFHSVYGSGNITTLPPELRIKLNNSFGQWLINENSNNAAYSAYFTEGYNFVTLLEGLYITVSDPIQLPGQGGIFYLSPYTAGAGLIFYYRQGTDTIAPQAFQIGGGCAYFNHFDHDYTKTRFYAGTKDSVIAPTVTYMQSMGGVKTQLSFPFLSNWKKLKSIVVNKAEVEVPVNTGLTGIDIPPSQAYLVIDSAGFEFSLVDQTDGLTYYNGTYDATNHVYEFDIDRYIQSVLDGKMANTGLYLVAGNNAISANGAALYGAAKVANTPRIRLKMYYTPVKQ